MHGAWTITKKELLTFFCSPIAYVVLVVFLAFNGFMFGYFNLAPGEEASLRPLFGRFMPYVLLVIIPMLTMRLMSDEYRSGTIETLMTSPVGDAAVILGKFFGAFLFYAFLLLTTLFFAILLSFFGNPDFGALVALYIGLLLMGALYICVGLFFSACTSNQVIAGVCSLALLSVPAVFAGMIANNTQGWLRVVFMHIHISHQFTEFVQGAININAVAFFVTSSLFVLFVTVKTLESRRWR